MLLIKPFFVAFELARAVSQKFGGATGIINLLAHLAKLSYVG